MPERLAVVALGQPPRDRDAGGQVGRRRVRRRGSLRAGQREIADFASLRRPRVRRRRSRRPRRRCRSAGAVSAARPPRASPAASTASTRQLLGRLLGRLALAHAALGLAVGEDLAEVAPDRLGAHPLLVAVAKPLLGRRRERQRVGLAGPADQLDLAVARADRQHDRRERGVQVGADPGRHGGALARVGVERLQAGARAAVHLPDVLVDGLDVGTVLG